MTKDKIKESTLKWAGGGKRLYRCETENHGPVALFLVGDEEFFYKWDPVFDSRPVYDKNTDSWVFGGKRLEEQLVFDLYEKGALIKWHI